MCACCFLFESFYSRNPNKQLQHSLQVLRFECNRSHNSPQRSSAVKQNFLPDLANIQSCVWCFKNFQDVSCQTQLHSSAVFCLPLLPSIWSWSLWPRSVGFATARSARMRHAHQLQGCREKVKVLTHFVYLLCWTKTKTSPAYYRTLPVNEGIQLPFSRQVWWAQDVAVIQVLQGLESWVIMAPFHQTETVLVYQYWCPSAQTYSRREPLQLCQQNSCAWIFQVLGHLLATLEEFGCLRGRVELKAWHMDSKTQWLLNTQLMLCHQMILTSECGLNFLREFLKVSDEGKAVLRLHWHSLMDIDCHNMRTHPMISASHPWFQTISI